MPWQWRKAIAVKITAIAARARFIASTADLFIASFPLDFVTPKRSTVIRT
jgi:hypothetical protein